MPRNLLFVCCAAIVLNSTASASDWTEPGGGVLAQIMDQGGARTTFTLVNLDAVAASYTLYFYGDNGLPLTLSTTAGAGTSLTGTIPVNGSVEFETNGSASAALVQGYAELVTNNTIAGSAIFGLPIGSGFYESTCPLDTGTDYDFGIPFDHTTAGTVVGVALANSYGYAPLNIAVTAYDPTGKQLVSTTISLAAGTHEAFLLTTQFPALVNEKAPFGSPARTPQAAPRISMFWECAPPPTRIRRSFRSFRQVTSSIEAAAQQLRLLGVLIYARKGLHETHYENPVRSVSGASAGVRADRELSTRRCHRSGESHAR